MQFCMDLIAQKLGLPLFLDDLVPPLNGPSHMALAISPADIKLAAP